MCEVARAVAAGCRDGVIGGEGQSDSGRRAQIRRAESDSEMGTERRGTKRE